MKIDDTTIIIFISMLTIAVTILCCLAHDYYKFIKEMKESNERFHSRISKLENHLGVNTIKPEDLKEMNYRYVSPWKDS